MSTLKRARVVMLPTNQPSNLFIINKTKISYSIVGGKMHSGTDTYQPQHLYIISDDEVKKDDWVICASRGGVYYVSKWRKGDICDEAPYPNKHKIIATTDKSLKKPSGEMYPEWDYLPEPSKAFIKKYCEKGGIDEVMVEYYIKVFTEGNGPVFEYETLKVASDNTITIKSIKDSWNREEVEELINAHHDYIFDVVQPHRRKSFTCNSSDWIKENLV